MEATPIVTRNHRAHGLSHGVESVNLDDLLLGHRFTDLLIVLTEFHHEPEQSALRLVPDLLR